MKTLRLIFALFCFGITAYAQVQEGGPLYVPSVGGPVLGTTTVTMTNAACNVLSPGSTCTLTAPGAAAARPWYLNQSLAGTCGGSSTITYPLGQHYIFSNSCGAAVTMGGATGATVSIPSGATNFEVNSPDGMNYYAIGGTLTAVTGTAPLDCTTTGSSVNCGMAQATSSVDGYLSSTDWTTFNGKQAALGFTPYNATNPAGYITSSALSPYALTSSLGTGAFADISLYPLTSTLGTGAYATIANYLTTSAASSTYQPLLGFTPYNSTNPSGYISGNQPITLGGILAGSGTTSITASAASGYYMPSTADESNWNGKQNALGFTPYNATNPAGYISSSALTPYALLAGATFSGAIAAPNVTDSALTSGNCVQASTAGILTTVSGPCGISGGSVTVTGSPTSGQVTEFSGGTSITNATSAHIQTAIGAGVYDASGAAAARQANLSLLPGTYTNGDMCTYASTGTLLNCNTAIPSVGSWGALNYPSWTSGTPFVKMTAAGTFALDTNTYLTSSGVSGMTTGQLPVAASATTVTSSIAYATANTASTIVERDGSGNFSAGTITAALTGTASGNDVAGAAATAQTNAETYAQNASHINTGTIGVSYLPTGIPIGSVGSAGLSGTSPISIAATGAISCPTCNTSSATVSSVTFTGDGTVDSSTPSTAVTTSGTVTATLKNQAANTVFGNFTGSSAAPTFTAAPTFSMANLTGMTSGQVTTALTYTPVAPTVTTLSYLTTAAGGVFGTAAFTASTAYDASGAASTAQSNAETYASNASNLTSGTVAAARVATLNQNTTGTSANITATSNSTITTLPSLSLPYSQVSGTPSAYVTFAATGGASAGSSFNGSSALTVDYHTVGAQPAFYPSSAQIPVASNDPTPVYTNRTLDGDCTINYVGDITCTKTSGNTLGNWSYLNYPAWTSGTPFVKMTAAGMFALDTNTYLTSLSGALLATGATTGATSQAQTFTDGVTLSNLSSYSGDLPSIGSAGLIQDSGIAASNVPLLNAANTFTNTGNTSFAGNVGIGTSTPLDTLHVLASSSGATDVIAWGNSLGRAGFLGADAADDAACISGTSSACQIKIPASGVVSLSAGFASGTTIANASGVQEAPCLADGTGCPGGTVYNAAGTQLTSAHTVMGLTTLSSGAATVTFSGSAIFTSSSSYACMTSATVSTINLDALGVTYTSGSSVTFSDDGGLGSDAIRYICIGN